MLFLDEVHRLDAQGQEKLFTWLDRKEIYRVGETAQGCRFRCGWCLPPPKIFTARF
jgi:transcriptional regulator with AAA-type ATPase domain